MSKFKLGDRVKIKQKYWEESGAVLKRFGFVEPQINKAYEVSYVTDSGNEISLSGTSFLYYAEYFELVGVEGLTIPNNALNQGFINTLHKAREVNKEDEAEYTGGSSSYYKVDVTNPTTSDKPYQAECNDIIEALGLTFTEGNIFKAVWRIAADRNGKKKKGNNSVYDAEKVVFFAERLLVQEKSKEK